MDSSCQRVTVNRTLVPMSGVRNTSSTGRFGGFAGGARSRTGGAGAMMDGPARPTQPPRSVVRTGSRAGAHAARSAVHHHEPVRATPAAGVLTAAGPHHFAP